MHMESDDQGYMNLRGQGQRSSQGQMIKMTPFCMAGEIISGVIYRFIEDDTFDSVIFNCI